MKAVLWWNRWLAPVDWDWPKDEELRQQFFQDTAAVKARLDVWGYTENDSPADTAIHQWAERWFSSFGPMVDQARQMRKATNAQAKLTQLFGELMNRLWHECEVC